MLKVTLFVLSLSLFFVSCTTGDGSIISSLHEKPAADKIYLELIEENSKHEHITRTFETVYKLNITQLKSDVMLALNKRFNALFSTKQGIIEKTQKELVFFVSIFAPSTKEADLANDHEWFIDLKVGDKSFSPARVVRLKKSKLWTNFFPYVDGYSKEFLIYFNPKEPVHSKKLRLSLSNSRAKTIMHW